jgi:HK97 gp10 family phage protein
MPGGSDEIRKLADHLEALAAGADTLAAGVATAMGEIFVVTARQHARYDTGFMHDHIQADQAIVVGNRASVFVTSSAEYDIYHEWGTSRMAPQPMFGPGQRAVLAFAGEIGAKVETAIYATLNTGAVVRFG